jgi:cell shape-determining protein MreD
VNYKSLIAIPVLLLAVMLQVSAGSHIKLMMGSVDLLLVILVAWGLQNVSDGWLWAVLGGLMLSLVSAMPFPSLLLLYIGVMMVARWFQHRMWQSPYLIMLLVTFITSWLVLAGNYVTLVLQGIELPWLTSFQQVMVPSVLLNLLIAFPTFALMRDLAEWLYPAEFRA